MHIWHKVLCELIGFLSSARENCVALGMPKEGLAKVTYHNTRVRAASWMISFCISDLKCQKRVMGPAKASTRVRPCVIFGPRSLREWRKRASLSLFFLGAPAAANVGLGRSPANPSSAKHHLPHALLPQRILTLAPLDPKLVGGQCFFSCANWFCHGRGFRRKCKLFCALLLMSTWHTVV